MRNDLRLLNTRRDHLETLSNGNNELLKTFIHLAAHPTTWIDSHAARVVTRE